MAIEMAAAENTLAQTIQEATGANAYLCYLCQKCTSGCPLAEYMDLAPHQVMHAIQLGLTDKIFAAKTAWLCISCGACTTRCPQGIDVAKIMDALKIMAQQRGLKPQVPEVAIFTQAGVRFINMLGRMYELGVIGEFNVRTGRPLRDAPLGVRLWRKGKLKLMPLKARYPKKAAKPPAPAPSVVHPSVVHPSVVHPSVVHPSVVRIAYYPGCTSHSTGVDFDISTRAVAQKLGLKLEEPKGWLCCGSTPAHWSSALLAATLPMKNLALVEKMGHQAVTTPCAACFSRLRHAVYEVQHDAGLRERVLQQAGYASGDGVRVQHLLDTFIEKVGLDNIAAQVAKPLKGLRVACYYGCLLTRPPQVTGAAEPEYPMKMDRLMQALGAEAVDWSYKTECCGASHAITQTPIALHLCRRILQNAQEVGAEALVVACPLCHLNLDGRQQDILAQGGLSQPLPVLYFTQLMGLALGLSPQEVALDKLLTDPRPLLRAKGLLS